MNSRVYRDLCQTYGINGYPTIRTFGFGKTIDKEVKAKDIHSIGQVRVVLEDFSAASSKNTLRGKVKDLAHDLDSLPPLNTTDMHRSAEWIVRTINAAARVSSSEDRLHDALVSLRFLLQTEVLPSSLSTEKLRGVQSFLELITALLPEVYVAVYSHHLMCNCNALQRDTIPSMLFVPLLIGFPLPTIMALKMTHSYYQLSTSTLSSNPHLGLPWWGYTVFLIVIDCAYVVPPDIYSAD